MVMFALFSLTLASCGDDDDDSSSSNNYGTWKITKISDNNDTKELVGMVFTFKNGYATYDDSYLKNSTENDPYYPWGVAKYTVNGSTLTVVMGEDAPDDDLITGTYTISGKTATYTYHWEDAEGDWVDNEKYTIWAEKQ